MCEPRNTYRVTKVVRNQLLTLTCWMNLQAMCEISQRSQSSQRLSRLWLQRLQSAGPYERTIISV